MLLLFLLCTIPTLGFAQNDNEADIIFIDPVMNYPQFPGGEEKLYEYIANNLRYPSEAIADNVSGRVFVKFVVEADGTITNVKVVRPLHPILDAEAVRVIEGMPKWIPSKQGDKYVSCMLTMPIRFELN